MAGELGLAAVLPQRGWEALKAIEWSLHARGRAICLATPEEHAAFKKPRAAVAEEAGSHPASGRGLRHR